MKLLEAHVFFSNLPLAILKMTKTNSWNQEENYIDNNYHAMSESFSEIKVFGLLNQPIKVNVLPFLFV